VIDELKAEIARLSGRIEDLERARAATQGKSEKDEMLKTLESRMTELEKTQLEVLERLKAPQKNQQQEASAAPSEATGAGQSTAGGAALFEKGKAAHAAGKFDDAVESLGRYVAQFPKGKNVEEALFLRGESHFLLKQYKQAIVDFSKVSEKFGKSKHMPAVLLKIGQSFEALGMNEDARGFYQDLVERFGKSPEAKKAKSRLKN